MPDERQSNSRDAEARLDSTLFDTFEYQGYFWLPSTPERTIPGVVRFAKSDISVDLLGLLVEYDLSGASGPPFKADTVLGETQNGKLLTLLKCTQISTNTTFPHVEGAGSSILSAGYLLVGKHYASEADLQFHSLSINYLNLEEWIAHRPFPPQEEEKNESGVTTVFVSKYVVPEKLTFPVASLSSEITTHRCSSADL